MEAVQIRDSLNKKDISENNFTYIFETYYKRVFNYIFYRVNSVYLTEDLTSEVFKKIMININSYSEDKGNFEVWMFTIARNVINDYLRKLRRRRFFSLEAIKELISKEKNPEEVFINAETNRVLLDAINTLNKREKNIIAFKFGANLKNKEIGDILNITESNVGVIVYRSMRKLKNKMIKVGENFE